MGDVLVAEIVLNEPRIVAAVGEVIAGRVPEHVGMDREGETGPLACLSNKVIDRLPRHRSALAEEQIA